MGQIPAVIVRAGDRIEHEGQAVIVTSAKRQATRPYYDITHADGTFTLGAAQPVKILPPEGN